MGYASEERARPALRLRDRLQPRSRRAPPPAVAIEPAALRLCRTPHGLVPGNAVTLLRDGDEAFPAMLEAIGTARTSVHLECYMFHDGQVGGAFADVLADRARAGVEVRIIYDGVGSFGTPASFWDRLRAAGARVFAFHPISPWRRLWSWNVRDHRKLLVVDDTTAFAGGLNISDTYLETEVRPGWRDTHLRVRGPVAADLDRLFAATWQYVTGEQLALPGRSAPGGSHLVGVIGSRLRRHRTAIYRAYLYAIRRAQHSIRIANGYFIPPRGVRRALRNAVRRGVEVEVIVPAWGDLLSTHYAGRRLFDYLLRHGIRVFLWPDVVMHAKTAVIDGVWGTIGSFNLDHRSVFHNIEVNLNLVDSGIGARMEAMFAADRERCREVVLAEWRMRALGERLLERVAYLFRHWL